MRNLLILLIFNLFFTKSYSQDTICIFKGAKIEKSSQLGNDYFFTLNILPVDKSWDCIWSFYDYKSKKVTKLNHWNRKELTFVSFPKKGLYQVRLNMINSLISCDTLLTFEVDITTFNDVRLNSYIDNENCRLYKFEMTDFNDTCFEYYHIIWTPDEYNNSLSDIEWETIDNIKLSKFYTWRGPESYNTNSKLNFEHEFKDGGRYIIETRYLNKCTLVDTISYDKLNVCSPINLSTKNKLKVVTDSYIIGYYDMIGRKVEYIEPNKTYIALRSNGEKSIIIISE